MGRLRRKGGVSARAFSLRLLLAAFASAACSGTSDDDTVAVGSQDAGHGCEMRAEPISAGMGRTASDGSLSLELVAAEPMPPATGDNSWTIGVRNGGGEPVAGATVIVRPYMIDHGHGSTVQQGIELEGGVYRLSPIDLYMPGYWELTFGVTEDPSAREVDVVFPVCIGR